MFCHHCASKQRVLAISRVKRCDQLYVIRRKQGRKSRFQTSPAPSRFSPRNSHRTTSKLRTRKAHGLIFLLLSFNWKFIENSKCEPPNNNVKSSNRGSNHPRLEFHVPACNCHVTCLFLIGCVRTMPFHKRVLRLPAARGTIMFVLNFNVNISRSISRY